MDQETNPSVSLTNRSLAAMKWNYAGVVVRILSQLVVGIVLARMLGPEPFGLFAATLLVTGLCGIVAEMGLGAALVQSKEITQEDIRAVFTRLLVMGISVSLGIVLAAGWLAELFNDKRLEGILMGGAVFLLLQSLSIVPMSLLRRQLDMKTVQMGQVSSYLIGFIGVGITLAHLGFGVLSLILAYITQSLLFALMMYLKVRHPIRPLFRREGKHLGKFGNRVVLTNLANWTIENMDNFLVGRLFGMGALGLYSVTYNLARTPTNHLMVTLQGVLFSASARAQENDDGLRRAYCATVGAVSLITFPAFFGAASVSSTVIEALYGHRWMNATPLFLPLALAMPIHALMVGSVILWAKGLVGRELRVQLWVAAVFIIMLLITSRISLIALAWGVFIVYFIRSAWLTKTILHSIQVPWQRFGLAIRGGLLLGLVTSLVLASLDHFLIDAGSAPITRLVMAMAMGVVLVAVMPVLMKKLILTDDLRWLFANVVQKLPARFHPLAKYLLI